MIAGYVQVNLVEMIQQIGEDRVKAIILWRQNILQSQEKIFQVKHWERKLLNLRKIMLF